MSLEGLMAYLFKIQKLNLLLSIVITITVQLEEVLLVTELRLGLGEMLLKATDVRKQFLQPIVSTSKLSLSQD